MANELVETTTSPMLNASQRAKRMRACSDIGFGRKRSTKSVITTAVIELTPESMLDIAAANRPASTSPDNPAGR